MNVTDIKGFDKVIRNLNREIQNIEGNSMKGLIKAAAFIRSDMDKTPPLIPLDTENLRASWHVDPTYGQQHPSILMGFSANYALFVHERVEGAKWGKGVVGKVNWSRPGSGPKFFESAMNRNHDNILKIIADNVKLSK